MLKKQNTSKHWVIMAAGTGGHVIPALSVAESLREKGYSVSFLGSVGGMEAELVPKKGFELDTIPMKGVRGKGWVRWLMLPFLLMQTLYLAWGILRARSPIGVLGMGGFVTVPGGIAAWILGIPLVLHEQNAVPGWANRVLKPLAKRVMVAFPGAFSGQAKVCYTGNPIRQTILEQALSKPIELPLKVLVVGGSLGAHSLNTAISELLKKHPELPIQVRHQTGVRAFESVRAFYQENQLKTVEVLPFIEDMAKAYAWADLVIGRAGAMTVSELAAMGRASILVPYPYAVDDHQSVNARFLVEAGAAFLLKDSEVSAKRLLEMIQSLVLNPERVVQMGKVAKALAKPQATESVVQICLEVCHES